MPRFSLVLPTLKRPDTFRHALATLIRQTSDDCEIVVQNNGRDPATEAIVSACEDPRVRHFSSDTVLPMSDNWEAALANTRGDFVTVIGDDDGLFPDACAFAAQVIDQGDVEIVSWRPFAYYWPAYHQSHLRNRLFATVDYDVRVEMIRSAYQLRQFYRFSLPYSDLPMIYNSFVHRAVIERAKAKAGRYFIGFSPDVVSGIVNAASTEQFALVSRPLSMIGISQHGTGNSLFFGRAGQFPEDKIVRDFGELPFFDDIPATDNLQLFIAHDMLGVRDKALRDRNIAFHYDRLLATIAAAINDRPERYAQTRAAIEQLALRHGIDMAAVDIPAVASAPAVPECGATFAGGQRVSFVIDGGPPGIANIDEAVRLIEQFRPRTDGELRRFEMPDRVMLRAGEPIVFSHGAGAQPSLQDGWGVSEEWGVWSVARRAVLTFVTDKAPVAAFGVTLKYCAFLHPAHRAIKFACHVRGNRIAEWTCALPASGGVQQLTIPQDGVLPDGTLTLEFLISEPRSPADLGMSSDPRKLGIGIQSIVLTAA
jgi:glycosyltransferase involved in cell wall biosynthesis